MELRPNRSKNRLFISVIVLNLLLLRNTLNEAYLFSLHCIPWIMIIMH